MILFSGFGAGTFLAGLLSDYYGRRTAIMLQSQLLFGVGILATVMPNYTTFVLLWFVTGTKRISILSLLVKLTMIFTIYVTGMAAIGVYTVCFVWAMESVAGRYKTYVGVFMNYIWATGM